jgi:serine/threonine-protein kinase
LPGAAKQAIVKAMPHEPDHTFLALQEALVGRYSLERELGRGGMGIVYLAREVRLDRPVALKLLPTNLALLPALRERFLREARTAAKLSHPNIVPIFAVDEVGEFVFFAMAYIEGETLGQRIRRRGPLSSSDAARILREIAWALAYAHAQGVVHRDIKPDNILLEEGSGRALVTDFGIAHVRRESGGSAAGEVVGTAEYMSPEQASGEAVDERSDMYSLGVLGYYVLTGSVPFDGPTVSAVLAKHITQPAPPLGSVAPEAPGRLVRAVDRCLVKEPGDRFANGEELAEALGQSLELRRDLPMPLRVFVKQNRESFRASGILALFLFLLFPALISALTRADLTGIGVVATVIAGFALSPLAIMAHTGRRLLKSGYGPEDARMALKADFERHREELAFEYGRKPTWIERMARLVTFGGIGGFLVGLGVLAVDPTWYPAYGILGLAIPTAVGAGVLAANRYERRTDSGARRRIRVWNSRVGDWLFKLAGIGLKPTAPAEAGAYRRTEIAIGMAADRLFEDLPKDTRKNLTDLPEVVRRLEHDARKMRMRLEDLNAMIANVTGEHALSRLLVSGEGDAQTSVAERKDTLVRDLTATRDGAQRRLSDAVASLETIRLGLLRMHAGKGDIASITRDLASAKDVSEAVERLLEGREEVEALLEEEQGS